jgi:hypothetical protein
MVEASRFHGEDGRTYMREIFERYDVKEEDVNTELASTTILTF